MGLLAKVFGESDGARAKRLFREEVAEHSGRVSAFRREAEAAGFSESQINVMAKFLAMSDHSHQFFWSPHWHLTTPPVDGHFKDREI